MSELKEDLFQDYSEEERCGNLSPGNYYKCIKRHNHEMAYGPSTRVRHWAIDSEGNNRFWNTSWDFSVEEKE